ncbi:seven-hairpin glycosidase [Pilatotrama ljubarskyi]|nr:seven-hairpin glycosidase [Pilatotrama ljubarskyi]
MLSLSLRTLALALAVSSDAVGVFGARIQTPFIRLPSDAARRRQDVKDIFLTSWNAYKEIAFPHDDLTPISESFTDGRNGWGASAVDALSTLQIFEEIVNFTSHIDFTVSHTTDTVSIFETTIRYLGGMLSAYELSGQKYPALIKQAEVLGTKMSAAFVNVVPFGQLDFNTSTPVIQTSNIAEAGTLTLEWSRLAKYSKNDTFRALAENSVRHIASLPAPIPAFPAQGIDPSTGQPVGAYVTWGGGSDSYLEYLIKYARITNTNDNVFADTWHTAVDSSIHTLLRQSTVGNHTYLADLDDSRTIRHIGSHLACFMAGNWIMGGKLLNNNTIVNIGLALNEGCWNTYASTATGIGPEAFGYISSDGGFTGSGDPSAGDLAFYNRNGFYILPGDSDYFMRPEVLESNFYAWRATGDTKFYERAVSATNSFATFLKTPTVAFAPIDDVDSTDSDFIDDMESFWFAEVLKYLYLTFDDPNRISLDNFVFNTEAHPFIAPPEKAVYGSGTLRPASQFQPFKSTSGPLPLVSFSPKLPTKIPN